MTKHTRTPKPTVAQLVAHSHTPASQLQARTCAICKKPKGTAAFRQDGGAFFAHPRCFDRWRRQD